MLVREEIDILSTLEECEEFGSYVLIFISRNILSIPVMRILPSVADIYGLYREWEILNPATDIDDNRACRRIVVEFDLQDENDFADKMDRIILSVLEQAENIFYQGHGSAVHGNPNAMVYTSLLYPVVS